MTNEEHTDNAQGATRDAETQAAEAKVEKMFEYGYRKSNYGPDELVTASTAIRFRGGRDAEREGRGEGGDLHPAPVLLLPAYSGQHGFRDPPVRRDGNDSAPGGTFGFQSAGYQAAPCGARLP